MYPASHKPYFGIKGGWLTFWVTVACATDMLLFGYDHGVFAGVIVTRDFLSVLNLHDYATLLGTITAVYDAGCLVGAMAAMYFGERWGRKKTIIWGTSIMMVGALLQITAYSVPQMIVGRVVAGLGNGLNTATAPLVLNVAGYSLSNWMTFAFSFVPGPAGWRFPLAFQLVFMLVLFATVPWLPESPRWLISHDRHEEAQQIIADLEDKDPRDSYVIAAYTEIVTTIQYEREHGLSWGQLLRGATGEEQGTCTLNSLGTRTKGAALSTATNWAMNFMVVEIMPTGIQNLGWRFYIIWTVFNFAFVPTVYFFYPETANRSLEDIDRFFVENNGLFIHRTPEALCVERPVRYIELENERVKESSAISDAKVGTEHTEHV
ncbi:MFS general substrate transporter [Aspergillus ellipticus CBS 707.79]|uniref:MFS general substrate transporter n=1 Tax=Aspergillus ellipticus CBS 707.79 TaxID=1448320 RepID=A0A319DBU6_9EURO|nr:MFS general substrate transporter [Aspergillus ellipticus CBS 707.79]